MGVVHAVLRAGRHRRDAAVGQVVRTTRTLSRPLPVTAPARIPDGFVVAAPLIVVGSAGVLFGPAGTFARRPRLVRFLAPVAEHGRPGATP